MSVPKHEDPDDATVVLAHTKPRPRLPDPGEDEKPSEYKPRRAREKLFERDDWKIAAIFTFLALVSGMLGGIITAIFILTRNL